MPVRILLAVIMLVVVTACETGDDRDGAAELACRHFRNIAADASAGLMTDSEIREKFQQVQSNSDYAEVPGMRAAGRALVAAWTSGTVQTKTDAVNAFDASCKSAGL